MATQPIQIPTTTELTEQNISRFESALNQTIPANDRSFIRVMAVVEAMAATTNYKVAVRAVLDTLALTASRSGLVRIGQDIGITPAPATAAQLTATIPASTGTEITALSTFTGDANGLRYRVDATAGESGGTITLNLTATETGDVGNLQAGDTLTITTPVAGVGTTATVTELTVTGTVEQDTESFRAQVLDELRSQGGGGNAADYRRWAQVVPGVARAYPYRGLPFDDEGTASPPDRTIYVEATTDVDPDGIPPGGLLTQVRDAIITDPETGRENQPLGLTNDTLYVEPIRRTPFFVEVRGLEVATAILGSVQADIEAALELYFSVIRPFVSGLDVPAERRDIITDPSVGAIVNDVVEAASGSIESVGFGESPGTFLNKRVLEQGELASLGGVDYVGGVV